MQHLVAKFPFLLFLLLQLVQIESLTFSLKHFNAIHRTNSALPITRLHLSANDAAATPSEIKVKLNSDMKEAMKAKEKERLGAIRAILTAIKQKEVDDRVVVDDAEAVAIMAKLVKQRRESIASYAAAGRADLVESEEKEVAFISVYMPAQMSSDEVDNAIKTAIAKVDAKTVKDMGKVMGELRGPLQGKADMSDVGARIKKLLG